MCSSKQGLPHKLAKLVVTLLNAVVVKVCPSFVFRLLHLRCWFVYRMVFLLVCIQQAGRQAGCVGLVLRLVLSFVLLFFSSSSLQTALCFWFGFPQVVVACFALIEPYRTRPTALALWYQKGSG